MKTLPILAAAAGLALVLSLPVAPAVAMGGGSDDTPAPASTAKQDYEIGVDAIQAGRYDRGIELMRKVVAAEPRNADAYNHLGYAHRKKGDLRAAGAAYETALKLDPEHKGALEYQGEMFLKLGRMDAAQANLARLEKLCPSGCEERAELARAIADHMASRPKGAS